MKARGTLKTGMEAADNVCEGYGVTPDRGRLEILFSRAKCVPELPGSARRLIDMIDTGEVGAAQLERIIAADVGLTASVLRIANATRPSAAKPVTSIRTAVLIMGQDTVKRVATSLMVQESISAHATAESFDKRAHARHSMIVAYLARYVHARKVMAGGAVGTWTQEDVFSMALLHDLGESILACVAPEVFQRVYWSAERQGWTIAATFEAIFGIALWELAIRAIDAWKLPETASRAIQGMRSPWAWPDEFTGLCCIHYGDYLATALGASSEAWPVNPSLEWEVQNEVGLADEEVATVIELASKQADEHMSYRLPQAA